MSLVIDSSRRVGRPERCYASQVTDRTIELGWRPLIVAPARRAALLDAIVETVAARSVDPLDPLARPIAPGFAGPAPAELLPAWQRAIAPEGYFNLGLAHG